MDDKLIAGGETIYLPHKEVITLRGVVPGRYTYAIRLYGLTILAMAVNAIRERWASLFTPRL
jgi:hypothetical protein